MKNLLENHVSKLITGTFINIFLGIYFLNVSNGNIINVCMFYIISYTLVPLFMYLIDKVMNKDNVIKFYRVGVLLNLIIFGILLILREKISNVFFIFAILYALEEAFYWNPYHLLEYNVNRGDTYKKYFSYLAIINKIISVVIAFVSGYLISASSFYVMFSIIMIFGFINFILTFKIKKVEFKQEQISDKNINILLKDKDATKFYKMQFFEGLSAGGALGTAIQFVIYLESGSEFSLGYLNAIFAILAIITSIIVNKYLKKNKYKVSFMISCIGMVVSTIPFIINSNFAYFLLYNIIYNITYQVTSILYSVVQFQINEKNLLKDCKIEHLFISEMYLMFGRVTGYFAMLILSTFVFNVFSMKLVVGILTLANIFKGYYYINMNKQEKIEEGEIIDEVSIMEC